MSDETAAGSCFPTKIFIVNTVLLIAAIFLGASQPKAQSVDPDRTRFAEKIIVINAPVGLVKVPFGHVLLHSNDRLLSTEGTVFVKTLDLTFNMPDATLVPYGTTSSPLAMPGQPRFEVRMANIRNRDARIPPLSAKIEGALRSSNMMRDKK